jgi:hypothetical protein
VFRIDLDEKGVRLLLPRREKRANEMLRITRRRVTGTRPFGPSSLPRADSATIPYMREEKPVPQPGRPNPESFTTRTSQMSNRRSRATLISITFSSACLFFLLVLLVCSAKAREANGEELTKPEWQYVPELLRPFWQGNIMEGESVLFIADFRRAKIPPHLGPRKRRISEVFEG